jgi:hypothetical protein
MLLINNGDLYLCLKDREKAFEGNERINFV